MSIPENLPPSDDPILPSSVHEESLAHCVALRAFEQLHILFSNEAPPLPEMLGYSLDYTALNKEVLEMPLPPLEERRAEPSDPPYLLFIARQRKNLGAAWKMSDLAMLPISEDAAGQRFMKMGGSDGLTTITPEDFRIYAVLSSHIYRCFFLDHEDFFKTMQKDASDFYEYERPSLYQSMKDLANFCGINAIFQGEKLQGDFSNISEKRIESKIDELTLIEPEEKEEIKTAFRNCSKLDILNEETIDRIKAGMPVLIPVGFKLEEGGGHAVSLVFYDNDFVICNRGSRLEGTPIVDRYTYDKNEINIDVIKYLLGNFAIDVPSALAEEHLYIYLYTVLPKILKATKHTSNLSAPSFKNQMTDNCSKASPMTAFKMMVYLKRLKEGLPPRAAAWAAKRAGDELSVLLRKEMIQKVETALPGLPSEIQLEIIPILDKAKERLLSKERGSF